ncbi:MAG TPA: transcription termination/antitermination protein NusG [Spirochaetota bacterium]|nr:transcription termination/antitermination protein NusG [Spirochaetota bacterium]HPP96166.1 transcription termination/antitermination protein NusG [Spirochaetota bacterium]
MTKSWYIIHTYSGHENKVKATLEKKVENLGLSDLIVDVKIPTVEYQEVKDGQKKTKSRKVFPGYVLVRMELNDHTWSVVKSVPGVTNFVGAYGSNKPRPLTDSEVASLFESLGGEGKGGEKTTAAMEFSVGEPVRVIDGPFNNFTGVVEEVYPEKGRLKVRVEIFGRGTPVDLDFMQVGKL